jgi:hypothetical protein
MCFIQNIEAISCRTEIDGLDMCCEPNQKLDGASHRRS